MKTTQVGGLLVYHAVDALGPGVAEAATQLIRLYAGRAGLGAQSLPPITLSSDGWDAPWDEVSDRAWSGNAGPAWTAKDQYRCLSFTLEARDPRRSRDTEDTPEKVIAHEIVHLRWWTLRHGREFEARVTALLHGAQFPPRGAWTRAAQRLVAAGREEYDEWMRNLVSAANS
jgi:hypothetical protein